MTVRQLTTADAAAFRALRLRALKEHPEAFTSSFEEDMPKPLDVTQRRIAPESGNAFWGAFVDGAMCGIIGLAREQRIKNRHKGDVVSMYVAPEFGRRGLAAALLDALIDYARDVWHLEQLVLTVTATNAGAIALYRAKGFASFGREPRAIQVDGDYFDKEHLVLFL